MEQLLLAKLKQMLERDKKLLKAEEETEKSSVKEHEDSTTTNTEKS